jgi:hypothetical protein
MPPHLFADFIEEFCGEFPREQQQQTCAHSAGTQTKVPNCGLVLVIKVSAPIMDIFFLISVYVITWLITK